ncbi:hypothetical protein P2H44_14400 [Albimonas sp. CAU 1670]|uniref:hypothetical protein n=1 Tax=Albimonas sp. CAU 1670 TaxID=3032599 RepID=UPI0023DB40CE|nr:hypothetical protein [Albimonas sp. CAU 1670]MDF2233748.1 hypothetical protein [Albimonas sp. CAU 1670]
MKRILRRGAAAALALALGGTPAFATTVADAALDVTLSNFSSSFVSWSQGEEPQVRSSRALGGGWASEGSIVQAQNRSIIAASAGVDARTGAPIDLGENRVELVRTFTLVNPTPYVGSFGLRVDYALTASVLGDVWGGVSGDVATGEVGRAQAAISFLRLDATDDGGFAESAFYTPRSLSVDYGLEGDSRFPASGKAAFYASMQVDPGEVVHLRVVASVSAAVYAAEGAQIPPSEVVATPAPPALALLGAAAGALGLAARRRRAA